MNARLDIFLPTQLDGRGPSYTCGMIARGMAYHDLHGRDLAINIVTPRARAFDVSPAQVTETLPYWARHLPYRLVRPIALSTIDATFLRTTATGVATHRGAYIWPNASLRTINELKRAGIRVFREMINGPRWAAKHILDEAYRRLGIPSSHGLDDASSQTEREALNAVDYVFSANAMVTASLLKTGLQPHRILEASYGWDPQRFCGKEHLLPPEEGITIVFVGTICVRKGAHLLLDYWAQSKLRGRLVLAGAMEPAIRDACSSLLSRADVTVLNYVSDVGALYRSADIFAFPTLEEGGPQVTYEACGCGLPVITTPMGAGRIVRGGHEGFVLDPYDATGWITAMRNLAEDHSHRRAMASIARKSAESYRWDLVSARRKEQLMDRLEPAVSTSCRDGSLRDARSEGDGACRMRDSDSAADAA